MSKEISGEMSNNPSVRAGQTINFPNLQSLERLKDFPKNFIAPEDKKK
jgi:hypothetical protein